MSEKIANRLFEEFPPITPEEWKAKIVADLKGADFDKKLVWKPREGFAVNPFYTMEDLESLEFIKTNPGEFPYVRGNKEKSNEWLIGQEIIVKTAVEANKKALEVLNKGVDSLIFVFSKDQKVSEIDLDTLLNDICIEAIELNFMGVSGILEFSEKLLNILRKRSVNPQKTKGSINYDPIGHFTLKGRFCTTEQESFEKCKKNIELFSEYPDWKTITISGLHFHNAGANVVQELAFSIAVGNEYMAKLTEMGMKPGDVNRKIKFHFGIGGNYFFEIAKFRAARMVWAQIVHQYGAAKEDCKMHIHAQTGEWNKTVYDAYTNMLRTTTEAMSAVLGGVESLVVDPFNKTFETPSEFSERIARNQQIILKEESYFDKIVDPAGGSYFIETLTRNIANAAYKLFMEIENQGGYLKAFRDELIQKILEQEAKQRRDDVANRRENMLGTNQYPNFTETKDGIAPEIMQPCDLTKPDAEVRGIVRFRGAQEIEQLRYRTDQYAKKHKRPLAFMLTYGAVAYSNARSQFSQNFFAVAGFEVKDNPNFKTIEDGVKAALDAKADIVVLCSADEEYPTIAPLAHQLIENKAITMVAGYPKDIVDELKAKGINHFIHIRSNVLETLIEYQKELGILQ